MRIVLFGPPGAGKGSQAELLIRRHGLSHISTGIILRTAMRKETPLGLEAKKYINAGELVPGVLVRSLAEEAIADAGNDRFVLDGYPRTVEQADWLTEYLAAVPAPLTAVVSLVVPDDVIVDRLSKRRVHKQTRENYHLDFKPPPADVPAELIIQRADDKPEAILNRLEVYRRETQPLEAYYREHGIFCEIDGVGTFEEVSERIEEALRACSA